jgi:hypothetical protein
VVIYTNPNKNWVWWSTRTPPKTGWDDLHEPHQKLGVMIYTNPTKNWVWWSTRTPPKTGCDDLHEPHQKLGIKIYTNPTKNWVWWSTRTRLLYLMCVHVVCKLLAVVVCS